MPAPKSDPELHGLDPGELLARAMNTVKLPTGSGPWEPPTPEELGRLLPHYRIERLLGRGGMGAVYKGIQPELERPVAIKILPAEIAADEEFVTRFRREARTLAKLQHSRIITIHDFGQTSGGHLYFVMEYIDGTNLREILRGPGLKAEQALLAISQICDALYAAHTQGVIHRDIKPENVLITRDGYVKLADFGLARPRDERAEVLTSAHAIMGTPGYMAPEQHAGHADHRSDIYALGVMLYEMLTGKRPEGAFDPPSVKVRVDVRLDQVVLKALQQEPERRYQQASELKTDVDRIRTTPRPARPKVVFPVAAKAPIPPKPAESSVSFVRVAFIVLAIASALYWYLPQWMSVTRKPAASVISPLKGEPLENWVTAPALVWASREQPFANFLGMEFVPAGTADVLFCTTDTRVQDFRAFVKPTGYEATKTAFSSGPGGGTQRGDDWRHPGATQGDDHPVVCVSWADAKAFCAWLTSRDRASGSLPSEWGYRLPTNAEWSAAVAGTKYPWGDSYPPQPSDGQFFDVHGPFHRTAPVKSFHPNRYGLFDISGNVWQWCEDSLDAQASNGANVPRTLRGGSFSTPSDRFDTTTVPSSEGYDNRGFRCVLARTKAAPAATATATGPVPVAVPKDANVASSPPSAAVKTPVSSVPATKDQPFVNSLGMKFVPVPGTKVFMCIHETRKKDYAAFAAETPGIDNGWKNPISHDGMKVSEGDDHPVVNVSSFDAEAFCRWLSRKEGRTYRLPSDREWSCAVGIGTLELEGARPEDLQDKLPGIYPWGKAWPPPKEAGNLADETLKAKGSTASIIAGYNDGFATTAPVMSYPPNELGIYDLCGNVWEWCQEIIHHKDYGDLRVHRGASWKTNQKWNDLWSCKRGTQPGGLRTDNIGFRCVLATTNVSQTVAIAASGSVPTATLKETTPADSTQFDTISLAEIANSSLSSLTQKPKGRVMYLGVPFEFTDPPRTFLTQNKWNRDKPTAATLKVNVSRPSAVRVLILGDGAGNPAHQGKEMGTIKFGFADGSEFAVALKAGTIIRPETWAYNDAILRTPPGDSFVKVYNVIAEPQNRGRPATGFLDMLVIDLPAGKNLTSLTSITIRDTSKESLNDIGPGFEIAAITVSRVTPAENADGSKLPFNGKDLTGGKDSAAVRSGEGKPNAGGEGNFVVGSQGASASTAPEAQANFEKTLRSYAWDVSDRGWVVQWKDNHEARVQEGSVNVLWHWWITGIRTLHVQFAAQPAKFDPNIGVTWVFDPTMSSFEGPNGPVGVRGKSLAATSTTQPSASSSADASTNPVSVTPLAAVSKPDQNLTPAKTATSHLANFVEEMPRATAWALAPLDVFVPPTIRQNADLLKAGLNAEGTKSSAAWRPVYTRGVSLCDLVLGTLREKEGFFQTAGGKADQRPNGPSINQWNSRTQEIRVMFSGADEQFRAVLQAAGGLSALKSAAEEIEGVASFPALAGPIPKPPPRANDSQVGIGAKGPAGTNFGWGDRRMKLHVSVNSGSELPVNIGVDCYWVGWDGKHHTTSSSFHKDVKIYAGHSEDFDVTAVALRDNGMTAGVLGSAPGVYRGWLVSAHNSKGQKVGSASNMPEFGKLVP